MLGTFEKNFLHLLSCLCPNFELSKFYLHSLRVAAHRPRIRLLCVLTTDPLLARLFYLSTNCKYLPKILLSNYEAEAAKFSWPRVTILKQFSWPRVTILKQFSGAMRGAEAPQFGTLLAKTLLYCNTTSFSSFRLYFTIYSNFFHVIRY